MSQDIAPVPELQPPGEFPTTADRTAGQYNAKAISWADRLAKFGQSIWAIAVSAFTNAGIAMAQAQVAVNAAALAASVQEILFGATNFKGLWQELAGPMSKPATVKHEGRFWLLLHNVADVAAQEPGVSSAWTAYDVDTRPQQQVSGGTVACIPGVLYIITGANVTLTAPAAGLQQGDYFGFRLATAVSGEQVVDFGTTKVGGQVAGQRYLDKPAFGLDLYYNEQEGWL